MVRAKQTAMRFTGEDLAILDALKAKLGLSATDIMRLALRRLSELENVKPEKPKPKPTKK